MKAIPLIALTALLSACSAMHKPGIASLEGEVFYLQRSALPPAATLSVSLQDVSRADAPATTLAQYNTPINTQVPLPFHLQYDPAQVTPGHSYAVSARIEADGRLLFISTERHSVNLDGSDRQPLRIRVNPALP
ncbi:YbaY family lipoprotein [Pseudomonas sp. 21LCFQ02]|uniref:YbaY family lipoprotein n=1 Tax=unclassified Pseudomonas TaxID=196821 RepID=UPI00209AEE12|nr:MULTISPECIES: YbaY family lipoprotein [unclassified Pseudomonas]MCO8166339.1 YbaY family lipoprotein [Pseudomonas sp. 21LCFQ02]MCQ9422642.1 YbaY family lipoprotein [Pseudomonas sp. LJDD11]